MTPRRHKRDSGNVHAATSSVQQLRLPAPFPDGEAVNSLNAEPVTVYTIGHSNHDAETFLALLIQHDLQAVIDVRSAPFSRHVPQFSRSALSRLLADANVEYVWIGELLGGRPDDPECYDAGGAVDYAAIARKSWYAAGIEVLLDRAAATPTAILCSEEDPRRCHRHLLIEPTLRAREAQVLHVRRDGSLETIEPAAGRCPPDGQLTMREFLR